VGGAALTQGSPLGELGALGRFSLCRFDWLAHWRAFLSQRGALEFFFDLPGGCRLFRAGGFIGVPRPS
jgi:hypothetical protein